MLFDGLIVGPAPSQSLLARPQAAFNFEPKVFPLYIFSAPGNICSALSLASHPWRFGRPCPPSFSRVPLSLAARPAPSLAPPLWRLGRTLPPVCPGPDCSLLHVPSADSPLTTRGPGWAGPRGLFPSPSPPSLPSRAPVFLLSSPPLLPGPSLLSKSPSVHLPVCVVPRSVCRIPDDQCKEPS